MTPYTDNILACYPALLERLASVPGVKRVLEAPDLEALAAAPRTRSRTAPFLRKELSEG